MRDALDNKEFAAGIFIDLKKAFDTVEHSILLHKLRHYGVRGKPFELISSYLSNRTHSTLIQQTLSKPVEQKHGVPQGSVLGPLFFIIYINDLHKAIKNCTTIHFADDTSLVCRDKSLKKLNTKVNEDLTQLVHWLRANKICLNASKTELILFKSKFQNTTKKLNFRLSGQKLELSRTVSYLGVIIDENLDWDAQLSKTALKLSRAVGMLSKLRHYLDYKTLLSVYYALFESHVSYFIQILGHIKITSLDKLEKLQNKALRIIHFKGPRESAKPLYVNSRILPIRYLMKEKNCLLAYDFFKNRIPKYFSTFLTPLGNNALHATRNKQLSITRTKTVMYGSHNICNLVTKDWNEIHTHLPSLDLITSKPTFKAHLHAYLLTKLATG